MNNANSPTNIIEPTISELTCDMYRTMANNIPQLAWITDSKGWIFWFNQRWYNYTGTTPEDMQGRGWRKVHDPMELPRVMEGWKEAITNGELWQDIFPLRSKEGEYHWFLSRAFPVRNQHGQIEYWFGTNTDITEQRETEERMKENADLFRIAIEAAPNAMIMVNSEGRIVLTNKQANFMFGYEKDEIKGETIEILVPKRFRATHPGYRKSFTHAPKARRMGEGRDLYAVHKNGSEFPVEIGLTPMNTKEGFFVISSIVDITTRKKAQADLMKAIERAEDANQSKSDFLANMSHEIRTPMNNVIGTTELLYNTHLTPEQEDYVKTISYAGEVLLSLINDILDFSKIEAGGIEIASEPFRIQNLVDEIIQVFKVRAQANNDVISVEYADQFPPIINGDCSRLRQVLFNLVGNAIKFTHDGAVIMRIMPISRDDNNITLRFEIQDSGIGIAPDKKDLIFEKFKQADNFTTKKFGGTGLGLAISKQLVILMGGRIGVESELDKGSCFWMEIPFQLPSQAERDLFNENVDHRYLQQYIGSPINSKILKEFDYKVLLVEDYPPNQVVAKKMLEKMGCEVDIACDGEEAIIKLQNKRYDIVFMDCQMPEMDGFEATRLIRRNNAIKHNLIVAMTANALEGDREKCLAAGMDDYVSKPIRSAEIRRVLSAIEVVA